MWNWRQIGAAASLCGLLAACGGGGGGGGTNEGSTIPARAGEAEIGAAGGTVDAALEGGTTLRIDIPADALKSSATLRIEPVPAQAGDLGGFRITPADLALAQPVIVTVTWASGQTPPAGVVLALRRDGQTVPISPAMQGSQLSFALSSLGKLPAALREEAPPAGAVSRARRVSARAHASGRAAAGNPEGAEEETLHLTPMTHEQHFDALSRLVEMAYNGSGTVAFALDVQAAIDAYVADPQTDRAAPELRRLAYHWEAFFCPQYTSAVSALETYNGSAGAVFERRVRPVVLWGRVLRDFARTGQALSPKVFATCIRPSGYSFAPVVEKLPSFIAAVENAVSTIGFDPLIDDELPPLIRVEEMLQGVGINGRLLPLLDRLAGQLRDIANESCRNGQGQDHHQKLLARVLADAGFAGIASFDGAAVKDDIQRCGMRLRVSPLDADGRPTETIHNLGASARPTEVLMASVRTLRIEADRDKLRALQCPQNTSANNEQLVFEAGASAQGLTELSRISVSNENSYLEQPQTVEFDAAGLSDLRNPATQTTIVRIRRTGGLCNGAFPEVTEHAVLVELNLVFSAETWSGTISGSYYLSSVYQYKSQPFPLFDVEGSATGINSKDTTTEESLSGTWNVAVDVVAGRAIALRILSASGSASRAWNWVTVNQRGRQGCKGTETDRQSGAGSGTAREAGSSGTLLIEPGGRYELSFQGAFAGGGTLSTSTSYIEVPIYSFCVPQISDDSASGDSPMTFGFDTSLIPPITGSQNNGVISGSVTRNIPMGDGSTVGGETRAGSSSVTFTWDLRRQ